LLDEKALMESFGPAATFSSIPVAYDTSSTAAPAATDSSEATSSPSSPTAAAAAAPDGIRELVVALLEGWRHEATHQRKSFTSVGGASKSEQALLQRVSDLVTEAHDR